MEKVDKYGSRWAERPMVTVRCYLPGDLYAKATRAARRVGMPVSEFLSAHLESSLETAVGDAQEFEGE